MAQRFSVLTWILRPWVRFHRRRGWCWRPRSRTHHPAPARTPSRTGLLPWSHLEEAQSSASQLLETIQETPMETQFTHVHAIGKVLAARWEYCHSVSLWYKRRELKPIATKWHMMLNMSRPKFWYKTTFFISIIRMSRIVIQQINSFCLDERNWEQS